ncbi:hypothetical protein RJT34_17615 [Clitoria ternatea]|uniref:Uncharacterized protein n=1 Tax=Clitoria ternatea TaxID=43366 RepID=A0AAN9JAV2_CLITE
MNCPNNAQDDRHTLDRDTFVTRSIGSEKELLKAASRKRRYRPEEDLSRGSRKSKPKPRGCEIAEFFEVFQPKETEGADKRRIFAIGNSFNQRLLCPVHLWFISILKHIRMKDLVEYDSSIYSMVWNRSKATLDILLAIEERKEE